MAHLVQTAVQLNQDGVNEFVRGNLTLALETFRHALQTMILFEPHVDHNDNNNGNLPDAPLNAHGFAAMGITYVPMPPQNNKGDPFVYGRPFIFNPALLPHNQDGIAVFSAGVVFNMAVVFHCRSLKDPSGPFRAKALHLYESSVDLFSKINPRYDLSGTIAAALNNKASIYYAGGDFERCDHELDRLQRVMVQAEYSLSTGYILRGSDFQGILLNLLTMRPPRVAEAA
ncbi:expressed unknown protein [Seminavis robusta]|uniref:Uncharacterized protein n=1 Tax=Seminavis robusta TaxID=568900 RepID=A0A9N8H6Z7_9STRA|nr:expressed unknown protein [Seminavis robusta]|eukprot:Sro186_g080760.1 n/a (229) ;mRNA; r:83216-83902